jgi:hypothetical protein
MEFSIVPDAATRPARTGGIGGEEWSRWLVI